jgi:hypothetical protein
VGSIEYNAHDWLLAAEYSRWYTRLSTTSPAIPPSATVSERGYVMVSHRLTPWFHPGTYYALHFPNVEDRDGPSAVQHDVAGTLRFDVNNHWLIKLEGHFMSGTAGLSAALNDGKPTNTLERNWGVFLFKTTAYF